MGNYNLIYKSWSNDPTGFWQDAAKLIDWYTPAEQVQGELDGLERWYIGATCNTCYNCLDRHVIAGRGEQVAFIYDSPVTNSKKQYSYNELLAEVEAFALVLQGQNITKGDRVIIYMPMVPEAAIAMLACARIGAVHSVVFGGFAAPELATRIDDCTPKLIVAASCGIEPSRIVEYKPLLDQAIQLANHKVKSTVILQRQQKIVPLIDGVDGDWQQLVDAAKQSEKSCPPVPVLATDPLYILYTSGTTGTPKGVVRDNGGHMVALNWSMGAIYNIQAGEVFWAASDVGWVVGHSYIVYGPLLQGATSILYEGKPIGTPDAGAFWRVIEDYKVKSFFTAPTAFRAIKKEDFGGKQIAKYDLSSFKALYLAGERADPDTIKWAEQHLKVPVIDHWWQTETGWAMACNPLGIEQLPIKYGSPTKAMPGYDIQVLDDEGAPVVAGITGNVVVKRPLPPGCLPTLWNANQVFEEKYFENFSGYYETSDAGYLDEDGYLFIMARTDDIINVAGHRLSTGAMEEILSTHEAVAECAVIGIKDKLKGQEPIGLIILNNDLKVSHDEIIASLKQMVRDVIGPVAAYKQSIVVARLPKTRSGKILRATLRKIADGEDFKMPPTIDDPEILTEISATFKRAGII
ncbi:MAG: AMP-binding protein [Rhizobiales bacterium]|nr:AMP-binding protein [Hyphomicrobiales bacterium]NRB14187.1 AMP-binding protein [Hyphomicrobiales bacterium]